MRGLVPSEHVIADNQHRLDAALTKLFNDVRSSFPALEHGQTLQSLVSKPALDLSLPVEDKSAGAHDDAFSA